MIIYGSTLSPYVRKVMAYAAEKGIDADLQPTGFPNFSAEFLEASPLRKMPALRDGDFTLADSSAIIHYLEAKHPEPALIPADPQLWGKAIWYEEYADTVMAACVGKTFFHRVVAPRFLGREGDLEAADASEREEFPPILDYLDRVVPDDGYLVGDQLTLADIAIASPFANFHHAGMAISSERYPRVGAYVDRILARPSFAHWIEGETALLEKEPA